MYFLLFILHGLTYSITSLWPLTFIASAIFFLLKYQNLKKNGTPFASRFIILMCYALPFSWRNILGGEYSTLPLSWFYLFGIFFFLSIFIIKDAQQLTRHQLPLLVIYTVIFIYTLIPLLIANSAFISSAISQFIVLTFNNIMIIVALFYSNQLTEVDNRAIKRTYILGAFYTGLMIIIQYLIFQINGFELGKVDQLANRQLYYYLFTDVSHGTLYLATAIFLAIYELKEVSKSARWRYLVAIIITLIGATITSARTGLVVLFLFIGLYILIIQKGVIRKLVSLLLITLMAGIVVYFFQLVRPEDSVANALFSSSGRTTGYAIAWDFLLQKPFFGYGLSRDYIAKITGVEITHLSILQYAIQGGIIFSLLMYIGQLMILLQSIRKRSVYAWLICIVLVGTCLVPDLFATRFITLLCMIALMEKERTQPVIDFDPNRVSNSGY